MTTLYGSLKSAMAAYAAGGLSPEALKPLLAPFGIYQQRNGAFMTRVRVTGGELSADVLAALADIVEACQGYAHISSRQDLQLHDVPPDGVVAAVLGSHRAGLPFKGGGGNTYRNTVVSADNGLSPAGAFDVFPYAEAVNRAVLRDEKAFTLPRKLKIGFFSNESERLQAAVQDLGFVARLRGGRRGFAVYAGGGQGRDSAAGLLLFDFLDGKHCLRATLALLALFHDHGDRANRHQARLRFVAKRLGAEGFLRLYLGYYADAPAQPLRVPAADRLAPFAASLKRGAGLEPSEGFETWKRIAVFATRFGDDVKSVRLFVPFGNLTAPQLRHVAALAKAFCPAPLRLMASQDILLPLVHASALPDIYAFLRGALADIDLTFESYKGHLVTCVGASVCKIGMVDAPAVAERLAAALDRFLPPDTPERLRLLRLATDELRISGCPNSCAAHHSARIGIGCLNQKCEGAVQPFARVLTGACVRNGVPQLSCEQPGAPLLPVAALSEAVLAEMLRTVSADAAL